MQRTDMFIVEDHPALWELADGCARLWNEVNFERRRAYAHYRKFSWYPKHLYGKYASIIGSATAQQVINKSNEAWRSFLNLKRLEKRGELPTHTTRVSMPRYWKRNGRRELRIIVRGDCYRLENGHLKLPKGLRLRIKGRMKWHGRQGRLEIAYDDLDGVWRGFMAVEVEKPPLRGGGKSLRIDLGIRCLATVWTEGWKRAVAFSGNRPLHDWWYWTGRISREQSRLARVNKAKTSKMLRRLYRIRRRRFRHAVNVIIKTIIDYARCQGFARIVIGDLKGVRNGSNGSGRANSMIHNFWSHRYIAQRLREKAEEHGIEVIEEPEKGTSSTCPKCRSDWTFRHKRLFKCLNCGYEAHRDVVGVLNIAALHKGGCPAIGVMVHPLLLRWNGMRWEPKRAVKDQLMNTLEAETESTR